jgi:hypothetical protein
MYQLFEHIILVPMLGTFLKNYTNLILLLGPLLDFNTHLILVLVQCSYKVDIYQCWAIFIFLRELSISILTQHYKNQLVFYKKFHRR